MKSTGSLITHVVTCTFIIAARQACNKVVRYIRTVVKKARDSLDGPNLETCLGSLGLKFHRAIYDHILLFTYSSSGKGPVPLLELP
jgi:hypothetical protein